MKTPSENLEKNRGVVLVTGAAMRIGRCIALTMAKHGWDVVVHYNKSKEEAQELTEEIILMKRRAISLQCDLSDQSGVKKIVPEIIGKLGSLTCVVNNASVFELDTVSDFSHVTLDRHMHVNLAAPLILANSLFENTPDGQQACIVNLLDQKLDNLNPDFLSYTLSKAALQCATTTLAQALAPRVRVVGVSPGMSLPSTYQDEENFKNGSKIAALGHSSTPQDIADAVQYLSTAKAVTGTIITVDGGQHLMPLSRDVMFAVNSNLLIKK